MTELEINGKGIVCDVKYRDVRNVYLRLNSSFQLEIVIPKGSGIGIDDVLEKKRQWLGEKVREISEARKIYTDNSILYKGEYLKVGGYSAKNPVKGVRMYKKVILIYENSQRKREEILEDFLTKETLHYVQEKVTELARQVGVVYNTVGIKKMKKWGYCTKDKDLFFNLRLICLPKSLADYVLLHELLHLKHFDHSKRFKRDMAKHFPDYKEAETVLKHYLLF